MNSENWGLLPIPIRIACNCVIFKVLEHLSSNFTEITDFPPLHGIFSSASSILLLVHIQESENLVSLAMILCPRKAYVSHYQRSYHLAWELPGNMTIHVGK